MSAHIIRYKNMPPSSRTLKGKYLFQKSGHNEKYKRIVTIRINIIENNKDGSELVKYEDKHIKPGQIDNIPKIIPATVKSAILYKNSESVST